MEEFKSLVTEVLTKHASAILLDPEWGLPGEQAPRAGIGPAARLREDRLRREHAGTAARSARRLVRAPLEGSRRRLPEDPAVLHAVRLRSRSTTHKQAWVERIGDECRANDIPFFLEFVGYRRGHGREGPRVREEEAGDRHRRDAGVHQGSLRRRRDEGRSARST